MSHNPQIKEEKEEEKRKTIETFPVHTKKGLTFLLPSLETR